MVWVRQDWWTLTKYVLAVCIVSALICTLRLLSSINLYGSMLLIPLVALIAKEQRKRFRYFTILLAFITSLVIFAISYPSSFIFSLLPGIFTVYICIRGLNIYKENYRLSQQHVEELAQAHRELQQTYIALQEASIHSMRYAALAERTRLARDIHDGLGHRLTSLIVQLQALEIMLPGDSEQAAQVVPAMLDVARKAMAEIRLSVRTWNEDESGLGPIALRSLTLQSAAHTSLALEFQQDDDLSEWSLETSVALYRILQEALTNIVRHAEATAASIEVREDPCSVIMTIADNGRYIASVGLSPGFGIKGMIERCKATGGSCTFSQNQPQGLKIQVKLPIALPAQGDEAACHLPIAQSENAHD